MYKWGLCGLLNEAAQGINLCNCVDNNPGMGNTVQNHSHSKAQEYPFFQKLKIKETD